MVDHLPTYISLIFGFTTIITLVLFNEIIRNSNSGKIKKIAPKITGSLAIWLAIQATITLKNVYNTDTNDIPPKIILFGILPNVLAILFLFLSSKGRIFIKSLPFPQLTYLHIVRIPIEFLLYWLFLHKAIPELMTFQGRNFDILAGITSSFIAYFGFIKGKLNRTIILLWNFICLGLLINIVVNAFLSAPSPFQQLAFDQPNIAILHFPFSWLPTFIVPVVLFAHLASIFKLISEKETDRN
jgi:hypothetical protein